ncbi:MAG: formylglycine-generating enzyme family protein, partial [Bacteroidales bacterium]|nr:formylglycine-generating enzyme family protein [Bacteroidales bacterium]
LAFYTEAAFGMELEMVAVNGGVFPMGATSEQGSDYESDEKPVHSVTLSDFYIGQYEVTQAQWESVMGTTIGQQRDKADPSWSLYGVGDDYPMYYVNWEEAQEFCSKLSQKTGKKYRLPTEAEWEYAARGGQNADGTKYAGSDDIDEVAWFRDNSGDMTHPVGQKKPNGLGLYDMTGNVWEWCSDWYGSYGSSSAVNPQGPSSGSNRVARGGSWGSIAQFCRVSFRNSLTPGYRFSYLGFRVVCER